MVTMREIKKALVGKRMEITNGLTGCTNQFTIRRLSNDGRYIWIYGQKDNEGTILSHHYIEQLMAVGACTIKTQTQGVPYEIVAIIK